MPEKRTGAKKTVRLIGAGAGAVAPSERVGADRERVPVQLAAGILRRGEYPLAPGRRGANSLRIPAAGQGIDVDTVGLLLTEVGDWRAQEWCAGDQFVSGCSSAGAVAGVVGSEASVVV
jgi:hypothetical protein